MRPSFLTNQNLQVLFFGGKGGVGKTTCATAAAFTLAQERPEDSFLLVSTDPAHSLLDIQATASPPANLVIQELKAERLLSEFKEEHSQDLRDIAERGTFLDDEDIEQFLALSLPGLDELMAFLEICRWTGDRKYDLIIVDSAPTGHTLRLLALPGLSEKWLAALNTLLAKSRYMKKVFQGTYAPDHLDAFLSELSTSIASLGEMLRDPSRFRFVPVFQAQALSLSETRNLTRELQHLQIAWSEVVCNGIYPDLSCRVCSARRHAQLRTLRNADLEDCFQGSDLWLLPRHSREITSRQDLQAFWTQAEAYRPEELEESGTQPTSQTEAFQARTQLRLPAGSLRLLVVAGKGGVGKTTLACATGLHLAGEAANREVLLFSTDPAHSLADCLDVGVGPEPILVCKGLTAMEIDAQAEFEALKQEYADELERFLGKLGSNLDLTFDREVMERIMDLSPPGLDEVMALLRAMDVLEKEGYGLLILDAAPTGHLIRLLETPELIEGWLKAFFNIFLKYKSIFRLPRLAKRLVRMSKLLNRFQDLVHSQEQGSLLGVSILTSLAFAETKDLVAACNRTGLRLEGLVLNMATPPSECPFCREVAAGEEHIEAQLKTTFPDVPQGIVLQAVQEPRGLESLRELGRALWEPVEF